MTAPLIEVTPQEAGQKLLQFLLRRLGRDVPQSAVMRWIRTGQVRVDKGRAKPFQRVNAGQQVRLPPRALEELRAGASASPEPLPPVDIVHREADMLVCAKPAGLPTHGGSGHADSLQARLAAMLPEASFAPTPAHRLDRDTSGLLLVALSYERLRGLQEQFKTGLVRKEYLVWTSGAWPEGGVHPMRDELAKSGDSGGEIVRAGAGKCALAWAMPLVKRERDSLLLVRLGTGRTHQIRVQLATRGHPVLGDRKYGGPFCAQGMLLHAHRLEIPSECFTLHPPWTGEYAVPRDIPRLQRPQDTGRTKETT